MYLLRFYIVIILNIIMKLDTVSFYSIWNKIFLLCFVTTISRILKTKYCDLCAFEDWKNEIYCMKDILCIAMKVDNELFFVSTFFTWYFHIWNLLLGLDIWEDLLSLWTFSIILWFNILLFYLTVLFKSETTNPLLLLVLGR